MRIGFITSTPLNVTAGSGTFTGITGLARALRALDVDVELVTPRFRLPIYTLQRLVFNEMLRHRSLSKYDVTVGFDMDGYHLAGKTGNVHVASIKGVIADEMRFESGITKATMGIQANCESRNVRRANMVITPSQYSAERIQELYAVARRPTIIPELIDLAAWEKLFVDNPQEIASKKFVVLTVCRFYPRKRMNILLGAIERLRDRIPELEMRIVGGGPEASKLRELCQKKNLEAVVIWREDITQAELAREYNGCHVFCLPSVQEGFGVVFLEAMANGKPIVCARAGAAPEVVQHGLLVEPDNEQALADAIESLYKSPNVRASLGATGKEFVKNFDARMVAQRFLCEMVQLLGNEGVSNRRAFS